MARLRRRWCFCGCKCRDSFDIRADAKLCGVKNQPVDTGQEPFHNIVFENEHVRIFNVELPPRQSTLLHQHNYDYYAVIVGAGDIEDQDVGEAAHPVHFNGGEVVTGRRGHVHKVTNVGAQTFRNVAVEVK